MTIFKLSTAAGREFEVEVEWDERREQWHFQGLGFDLWAYPIASLLDGACGVPAGFQAEVEHEGGSVLLWFPSPDSGVLTPDLFATKVVKELTRFWDAFGELGGVS